MRSAFHTLRLDRLDVFHAGTQSYGLAEGIRDMPATEMNSVLHPLRE